MNERYFEIAVCQDGFRKSNRWTDKLLLRIKVSLGEMLENEIESMRRDCERANAHNPPSSGNGRDL